MQTALQHLSNNDVARFLELTDKIMEKVTWGTQSVFDTAVTEIARAFNCDNCSIFLKDGDGKRIRLAAISNPLRGLRGGDRVSLLLTNQPSVSATGYVCYAEQKVNWDQQDMIALRVKVSGHDHLIDGTRHSLLALPLLEKGTSGKVIGIIKCENKRKTDGRPADFSASDSDVVQLLAQKLALAAHLARVGQSANLIEVAGQLAGQIQRSSQNIFVSVLQHAAELLGAYRGDFVWWSVPDATLKYAACYGVATNSEVTVGATLPTPSFVQERFSDPTTNYKIIYDLGDPRERASITYLEANIETRSELAVRVDLDGHPAGVLNLESKSPRHFSDQDAELLRIIGSHAAVAAVNGDIQRILWTAFEDRWEESENDSPADHPRAEPDQRPPAEKLLEPILDCILATCGFDEGILYWHEPRTHCLRVGAARSKHDFQGEIREFKHQLEGQPSFARWLFENVKKLDNDQRTQDSYIVVEANDDRFNANTRDQWGIKGNVLGKPISFRDQAVGCLVLWTRSLSFPSTISHARLHDLTKLAAARIHLALTERDNRAKQALYDNLVDHPSVMVCTKRKANWGRDEKRPQGVLANEDHPKLVFDMANRAWLDFMGFKDLSEVQGKTDWDLFPAADALKYYLDDVKAMRSPSDKPFDEDNIKPLINPPVVRHVRVWKRTIMNDRGDRELGIQVVFIDRSDQWEKAEHNAALWADFRHRALGAVTFVKNLINLELEGLPEEDAKLRHVLRDNSLRIDHALLLMRLLYEKEDSGDISMKPFVEALVEAACKTYNARQKPRVDVPIDLKFPQIEARYCGMVVSELVANALEHAFDGLPDAEVRVSLAAQPDRSFVLTVADNGKGMIAVSHSSKLGLRLVERFAQALGGYVEFGPLETSGSRPGTRAHIRFQPGHNSPTAADMGRKPRPGQTTVLIAEDDPTAAMLCQDFLERHGCFVYPTAYTKQQLLDRCKTCQPAIIVLDIALKSERLAGLEAADEIRQKSLSPASIIIFLTANDEPETMKRITGLGAELVEKEGRYHKSLWNKIQMCQARRITSRKVFVCYSSSDKAYVKELLPHLQQLRHTNEDIEEWSDLRIEPGTNWQEEILLALDNSAAAVLLVSATFMVSDFINSVELPKLLNEAETSKKVCIQIVKINPTGTVTRKGFDLAKRFQFVARTERTPVSMHGVIGTSDGEGKRNEIWDEVRRNIQGKLDAIEAEENASQKSSDQEVDKN